MNLHPFFKSLTVTANGPIASRPVLSGLHLRFLECEDHLPISETLHAAVKELAGIQIMEVKGVSDTAQVIELPQEAEIGCLVYQFMGNSVLNTSKSWKLKSGQ